MSAFNVGIVNIRDCNRIVIISIATYTRSLSRDTLRNSTVLGKSLLCYSFIHFLFLEIISSYSTSSLTIALYTIKVHYLASNCLISMD